MNLALRFLEMGGETQDDYDGFCIDLAGNVVDNYGGEAIAYQEGTGPWRYHAAAIIGGLVHDAWLDEPVTEEEWLRIWGGTGYWRSDEDDPDA